MVPGVISRIDRFPKLLTALPCERRLPASTRSETSFSEMRVADNACRSENKKKPGRDGRAFLFSGAELAGRRRGELRDEAFERLVGLLGEIGIKPCDLLRLGHEGLIGGLREFGLHFNRLVQRLHAGQL